MANQNYHKVLPLTVQMAILKMTLDRKSGRRLEEEGRLLYCFGDCKLLTARIKNTTVAVQSLSCVWLFETPWTAAHQASLSFTISQSLLKLMSIESVMPSNHLILCHPLLFLPSASPSIGTSPMSQLFTSGGQSIGASALVLPMTIQGYFPLGWTGLISLKSNGLSRVFSNTTVQKHQFFGTQPSLWSNFQIHM